jgi:hypothetical protein
VQLYRYFVSQSIEFCHHNPLCCFSMRVYSCCLFIYDSVRKLLDTTAYSWKILRRMTILKEIKYGLYGDYIFVVARTPKTLLSWKYFHETGQKYFMEQSVWTVYLKSSNTATHTRCVAVVSARWGADCVRLRVVVKSDNCGVGQDCSGKGVCFSNISMVSVRPLVSCWSVSVQHER